MALASGVYAGPYVACDSGAPSYIYASSLALLGLLTTLFFYLVGPPEFRVWTMLALSLGFAIALVPYHALIRLLSNP